MTAVYDLLIVGGGPSGLSAAINGASEGLKVLLLDAERRLGGQAQESAAIENFPGFPEGITGERLTANMVMQADRFHCETAVPAQVVRLMQEATLNGAGNFWRLDDDHGTSYLGRAVLLSNGLSYRRLNAPGLGKFMGRGCYYGAGTAAPTHRCEIAVVGGANSAGQAVLNLAKNPKANVKLLVRKTLEVSMSAYLIDRIRKTPNIEVCENCEVLGATGSARLQTTILGWNGETLEIPTDYLFIYIGAVPRTWWLAGTGIELDKHGFIVTGHNGVGLDLETSLPFETNLPGVFAAGDVRSGSVKRIASAVGEGAQALQMIHRRLSE
jgi:thioredoxin reductase (NADPH)